MDGLWSPYEKAMVDEQLSSTIVGDKEKVKTELEAFIEATQADEVMIKFGYV
ncbi:luciferase [Bacillus safensis FO-36b] [Bacillus safensis subsp. safensis]